MKVLLLLEHHFFQDNNGEVWCERIVDYEYLSRYLTVFEEVYVAARVTMVNKINQPMKKASGKNVTFVCLPDCTGAVEILRKSYDIKRILKRQFCVDCIILRAPSPIALVAYSAIKALEKTIAIEFVMSADNMLGRNTGLFRIGNKIIDAYFKKMCSDVEGVSYVTNYILQQKYPCKYYINGSGFTEAYSSIDLTDDFYWKRNWKKCDKPEQIRIIHTGYMDNSRKGQDILIRAIAELKKRGLNVKLELIGDGRYRKQLEILVEQLEISEIVEFSGLITEKQKIAERLKNAHLYVMPTKKEGLPRCIIEAMAVGLPVIASDVDGIPELIEPQYMIHKFDYLLYADKILELINNWEEMCRLSRKNYSIALNYKKEKLDIRRIRFYRNLKRSVKHRVYDLGGEKCDK